MISLYKSLPFAFFVILFLSPFFHTNISAQPNPDGVWQYNATLEDYDLGELCPVNVLNCWECDNSYMLVAENYCSDDNIVLPEMVNAVNNWMGYIPDETPLNKMSIPGTHDSGAERWEYCGGPTSTVLDWATITQSFSIAEQLKMGIRYFDIRVRENESGKWNIQHGSFFMSLTFDQVLAQMNNFLEAHPSEGIIMSVQREAPDDNPKYLSILTDYMESDLGRRLSHPNPSFPFGYDEIPTMKDIRNSIMVLTDIGGYDAKSLDMDFENHYAVWDLPGDVVDDSETATLNAKKRLVIEQIKKAHDPGLENWIVTFLSGATHMPIGCVAARTNDVTFQYLNELPSKTNVGTIMMDFPGYGLVYRIIKTNFVYDKQLDLTVAIDCHHSLFVGGASDSRIKVKLYNGGQYLGEDSHVAGCSGLGDSFYQIKTVVRAMPQDYTHFTVENTNPEEGDGLGIDEIYISRTKYGIGGVDGLSEDLELEKWGVDGGSLWCLGVDGDDEYGSDASGCYTYYSFFSGDGSGYPGKGAAPTKLIGDISYYTQGCVPLEDQVYAVKGNLNPDRPTALCGPNAPPIIFKNDTALISNYYVPDQVDLIINSGVVVSIPNGVSLTLGSGSKLINNGTIISSGKIIVHSTAIVDNNPGATINSIGQYFNFGKTNNYGEIYNPVGYYGKGQGGKQTLVNPVIAGYLLPSDEEGGEIICESLGGSWGAFNICTIEDYLVEQDRILVVDTFVSLVVNGVLTNDGTILNRGFIDNRTGTVNDCGEYNGNLPSPNSVLAPCEESQDKIICENFGGQWNENTLTCVIDISSTVDTGRVLNIGPGVSYYINDFLTNKGTIINDGTVFNTSFIDNTIDAYIINNGVFTMDYDGSSGIGSTMSNEGEVRNHGIFNNITDNNGGISGCGTFDNICGAQFTGLPPKSDCGIFYNGDWPEPVPPQAITRDISIVLDSSGYASITADEVNMGSNDACGIASISLSKTEFQCSDVGPNSVTLTVTDNAGNTSTSDAIVTVQDIIPPVIASQDKFLVLKLDATGIATVTADDVYSSSTDLCGIETLSLNQTEFNRCHVGSNTIILTVSDKSGNESTTTILISVEDTDQQLTVMQPDCENPTGTIEVDVRSGTDTYSFDNGISFQESNFIEGLLSGNYNIVVKTAEGCTTDVAAKISEQPLIPSRPGITVTGPDTDAILVSDSAFAYQWYKDGEMISEATNDTLLVSEPGSYTVVVFGEEGCESDASEAQLLGNTGLDMDSNSSDLKFYPNPVSDMFTISFGANQVNTIIKIYQLNGKHVESQEVHGNQAIFNMEDYPQGLYIAEVISGDLVRTIRFVKE